MFENPRRGRQARNFTTNVPKILDLKSSSEQIFLENWCWVPLIIGTLCLKNVLLFLNGFGIHLNNSGYPFQKFASIQMAWAICWEKVIVRLNSLGYPCPKKCHLFERLGLSIWKKLWSVRMAWDIHFKKLLSVQTAWAIRLKKKLLTVRGTEPICLQVNFSWVSIPKPFHL